MIKTFSAIAAFVMLSLTSRAQQRQPFDPDTDIKQIQGLTVRIRPAPRNTFLYDIFKGDSSVMLQSRNPFNRSFRGFLTKEDAFKTAAWAISEYKKGGRMPDKASMQVARQLNVKVSELPKTTNN